MSKLLVLQIFFLTLMGQHLFGQEADSSTTRLSVKDIQKINEQSEKIEKALREKTIRYLEKISEQEQRLLKKLYKYDSSAKAVLQSAASQYLELENKVKKQFDKVNKGLSGQYIPYLDSLQGSLGFLQQNENLVKDFGKAKQKISSSVEQVEQLKSTLTEADEVKQYLQQRQQQIKQLLDRYTKLPGGITKSFNQYKGKVFYYGQQVRELKEALNDPNKMQLQVLKALNQIPAFKDFMRKNSVLAGLFNPMGSGINVDPNLQTRAQVQQMLSQVASNAGPNGMQVIGQQMQQGRAELSKLQNKLNQLGGSPDGDLEMPDFKPKNQKTKTFLQRLEYGSNLQTTRATNFYVMSLDVGFSLGYKISDRSIVGIGASGNIGLGKDWKHVRVSADGIGLRTFFDWQIKGQWWISAGAEMNYRKSQDSLHILKDYSTWHSSALLGISKKYRIGKKLKGNIQLLYDFLAIYQVPREQSLKLRIGYNF